MEVAQGIHRLEGVFRNRILCLYLLVGESRVLLFDTGVDSTPQDLVMPYLRSIGVDPARITYVVTSHADIDHMGGNASIRNYAPHAALLCHELDRPMVEDVELLMAQRYGEFSEHGVIGTSSDDALRRQLARASPVDVALVGSERIRIGSDWIVNVLHTPGHSRGHISLWDSRSRTAIVGDAVLSNAVLSVSGEPASPPPYRFVSSYCSSIQQLERLNCDLLLTSHYPIYRGTAVTSFLARTRDFVDQLDQLLRLELQASRTTRSIAELIPVLASRVGQWPVESIHWLASPLLGHLERFKRLGLIRRSRLQGEVRWRWIA